MFVAALTPDEGESVAEVFYREKSHAMAPQLSPDAAGFIWMPEAGFQDAFAQNLSREETALLSAVQRPIAVACIQEKSPKPAWKSKASWFLVAEEDRMINPATQHYEAKRMRATIHSAKVDHSPILTAPHLVVDLIVRAAEAANTKG